MAADMGLGFLLANEWEVKMSFGNGYGMEGWLNVSNPSPPSTIFLVVKHDLHPTSMFQLLKWMVFPSFFVWANDMES